MATDASIPQAVDGCKPYRPSNADEGYWFESLWCNSCQKDRVYRETDGARGGCKILAYTNAFDIDDPEYPKEWVTDGTTPRCTAYEENRVYRTRGPAKHLRDNAAAVGDLFQPP